MSRTIVTRDQLIHLWTSHERVVSLPVMLTTAELESGIGKGLYDATAERFEPALKRRKSSWTESECTSYGLFQILGINWPACGIINYPAQHQAFLTADPTIPVSDLILVQMTGYDRFMRRLVAQHGLPLAFKRYNGSGPAADRYQAKAEKIYARLLSELPTT